MKAKIISSSPVLLVKDVIYSANWYKKKCGFEIDSFYGEPACFCILTRDGYYLMLAQCSEDKIVPFWKLVEKTPNAYFWVDDAESLFEEFKSGGAKIDYELCLQPYGVKEFGISDPDGYDISFGQIMK